MIKRVALFLFVITSCIFATDPDITRGGGSFVGTQNQVFYKTITPSDLTCYPYEIATSGRYVITRDFYHRALDAEKNGQPLIRITASNVTIDFQTFTLYQSTADNEYKSDLISIEDGANNVVLMNGTLSGANGFGIKVTGGASNIVISDMRITACTAGGICIFGNEGVILTPSRDILLQHVICHNNARDNRSTIADNDEEAPGLQYYIGSMIGTLDDSVLFKVGAAGLIAANVYGLKIQDCSFSNTGVNQSLPVYGVYIDKCQYVSVQDTEISLTRADHYACGLYVQSNTDVLCENVRVSKSISNIDQVFGIIVRSCQGVQWKNVHSKLHAGYGSTGIWIWNSNGINVEKTVIQNNTASGSLFVGGSDITENDPSYFPVYRYDVDSGTWDQNTNYSINLGTAYNAYNARRLEIPTNSIDPEISDDETFVYTKWQTLMNAYSALDVALDYWRVDHYAYGLRILDSEYVHVDDIQVIDTNAQYSSAWGILIDGGQGNIIQNALVQGTQGFSEFDPTEHATASIQFLFPDTLDEEGALNDDETISMLSRACAMEIKNCAQGSYVRHCVFKQTSNAWGAGYGLFLNNSSKASVFDVKYEHNLGYDFGGGLVNRKYDPTDVVGGSTFFVNGWEDNFNHNWLLFWSDGGKFSVKHVYPGDLDLANNIGPYDNLVIIFDSVTQQTITCPADELTVNSYIVSLPIVQVTFIPYYTDSGATLSGFTFELSDDITLSDTLTLQAVDFTVSSVTTIDYDDTATLVITGTGTVVDSSDDSEIEVTFTGNIYAATDEDGNLSVDNSDASSTLLIKNGALQNIAVLDVNAFVETKMQAIFQFDYTVDTDAQTITLQWDAVPLTSITGSYTLSNFSGLTLNGDNPIVLDFDENYDLAVGGTVDVTDADENTVVCTITFPTSLIHISIDENGAISETGTFSHLFLETDYPLQYISASSLHFIQNISVDLNFDFNSTNRGLVFDAVPFTIISGTYALEDFTNTNGLRLGLVANPTSKLIDYSAYHAMNGTKIYLGGTVDIDDEMYYVDGTNSYVYITNIPSQGALENNPITLYADSELVQKALIITIDELDFTNTILGRLHFNYDGTDLTLHAEPLFLNDLEIFDWDLELGTDAEALDTSAAYAGFTVGTGTQVFIGGTITFEDDIIGYIDPAVSYTYVTDTPSQGSTSNGILYVYEDDEYADLLYTVMLGENIFTNYVTAGFNFTYNRATNTLQFDSPAFSIAGGQYVQGDFSDFELTLGIDPAPQETVTSYVDFGTGTKVYIGGTFDLDGDTVYINGNTSFTYLTGDPDNVDGMYGHLDVFAESACVTPVCTIDLVPAAFTQAFTFNFFWNNEGKMIFSYNTPVNGFTQAALILDDETEIFVLTAGVNEIPVTGGMVDTDGLVSVYVSGTVYISWSGVVGEEPTIHIAAGTSSLSLYSDVDLETAYDPASLVADAFTFTYDPNDSDLNNQELYTFDDGVNDGGGVDGTTYLGNMNFYYDGTRLMYATDPITIDVGGAYTQDDLSVFGLTMGTAVNPIATTLVYSAFNTTNGTKIYLGGTCMLEIDDTPTVVYIGGANSYVYVTHVPGQGLTTNGVLTVYSDSAHTAGNEIFTVVLGTSTFEQVVFGNISFAYDDEDLLFASPGLHITSGQYTQDDFTNYSLKLGTSAPATGTTVSYSAFNSTDGTQVYLGGSMYLELDGTPTKVYVDGVHSYVYVTDEPGQGGMHVGYLKVYRDQTLSDHLFTMILGDSDFRALPIP